MDDCTNSEVSSDAVCTIGLQLNEECHKKVYCKTVGVISASSISTEQRKLLEWRTGLSIDDDSKICCHHEKMYLARFESLQKYCCDPKNIHKRKITSKWFVLANQC